MKLRHCPCCEKQRKDDSPRSYVWWTVKGHGLMCWACWDRIRASFHRSSAHG